MRRGDGLRGYLVPHLGHTTLEIFMLNCPWNHTSQTGESKKRDWHPGSFKEKRVSPLSLNLLAKLGKKFHKNQENVSLYACNSSNLQPSFLPPHILPILEAQYQVLDW